MTLLRRPGVLLVTMLFVLTGAAFLTQLVPYRQIIESQRAVETARTRLATLEDENRGLSADVAALHTPAEIERLAREKLGYVRAGETAYVVLDPPDTGVSGLAAPEEEAEVPLTWVERVWAFLTGSDLDPDP